MGIELSIILVNWNGADCIGRCLASLPQAAGRLRYETMVVDNASEDGSVTLLRHDFPHVTVIENSENIGFGRAAQQALAMTRGEFVAVLNPDLILEPRSLAQLVDLLRSRPRAAWTGPRVVGPGGQARSGPMPLGGMLEPLRWFPLISRVPARLAARPRRRPCRCGKLQGACMVFRTSLLRQAGGMPTSTFLYGEEQLLGTRFRQLGYEIWYDPWATVTHEGRSSTRKRWTPEETGFVQHAEHSRAMRETLGPRRFLVYNTLYSLNALLTCAAALVGGRTPVPVGARHLLICLQDFKGGAGSVTGSSGLGGVGAAGGHTNH